MDESPFARVPAELRNTIYEHALYEGQPVAISRHFTPEPALLRTCKQIRKEAELLFYSINDFSCTVDPLSECIDEGEESQHLVHWLEHGPQQKLSLIRSLTIRMEVSTTMDVFEHEGSTSPSVIVTKDPLPFTKTLHDSNFGTRRVEHVVKCIVNGSSDDESSEEMAEMDDRAHIFIHVAAAWFMIQIMTGKKPDGVAEFRHQIRELRASRLQKTKIQQ